MGAAGESESVKRRTEDWVHLQKKKKRGKLKEKTGKKEVVAPQRLFDED